MNIIGCDLHTALPANCKAGYGDRRDRDAPVWNTRTEKREPFTRACCQERGWGRSHLPCALVQRLLAECGHELWVGDATRIRAREVRRQKTDVRDAELLLDLLLKDSFPRIWVSSAEECDLRHCWSIATTWCGRARRTRTICRRWPSARECAGTGSGRVRFTVPHLGNYAMTVIDPES